jgi:hypothetical protein
MFANLIEDINDGTTDHDYDLRKVGDNESIRRDVASPADQPAFLRIAHQSVGKGDGLKQRSLVQFTRTVERSEDQVQGDIKVNVTVEQPVKVATSAQVLEEVSKMLSFFGVSGNPALIISGTI